MKVDEILINWKFKNVFNQIHQIFSTNVTTKLPPKFNSTATNFL